MKSQPVLSPEGLHGDEPDFSVVLGGPHFQLMRRTHLSDDAMSQMHRRIIFISLFCWLPLLFLSALQGQVFDGNVAVPFLRDLEVHVRFLVVIQLLKSGSGATIDDK